MHHKCGHQFDEVTAKLKEVEQIVFAPLAQGNFPNKEVEEYPQIVVLKDQSVELNAEAIERSVAFL